MGDVLDLKGVRVCRSGRSILDEISWSVNTGERWVILGPNGAGKTTLVQLVSGRLHPTIGAVTILGEELGRVNLAVLRPLVGVASSALDKQIPLSEKVFDVVRTAAYGMTASWREQYEEADDQRAKALLKALGVADMAERTLTYLSTGERKRVAIARALMPNPEVLVLDEPASGLDLGGREYLLKALCQISADPYAPVMLLVTHHVEEIPQGFTHALLLKQGKIYAAGRIDDVLTSANLSGLFDIPIVLTLNNGRYSARAI